jgi:hypothetical protein
MTDDTRWLQPSLLHVLRERGHFVTGERLEDLVAARFAPRGPAFVAAAVKQCEDAAWRMVVRGQLTGRRYLDVAAESLTFAFAAPGFEFPRPCSGDRVLCVEEAEEDRLTASVHEASHAVCCVELGGVAEVAIGDRGDGSYRALLPESTRGKFPADAAAVATFAGPIGERRFTGREPPAAVVEADERNAARHGLPPARLAQLRERAEDIVSRRWGKILWLACDLFEQKRMTADDVRLSLREQSRRSSNR